MAIHGDTDDKCTAKQYKRFLIDSPLDVRIMFINSKNLRINYISSKLINKININKTKLI
jgi:hypothetical protein